MTRPVNPLRAAGLLLLLAGSLASVETAAAQRPRASPMPGRARAWSLQAAVTGVFDSNIDHEEPTKAEAAPGVIVAGTVAYEPQAGQGQPDLQLAYGLAVHAYGGTDRWDRVSHELDVLYGREFAEAWALHALAGISLKGSTEDRDLADEYLLGPRLTFRPTGDSRLRLTTVYRLKRYADRDYDQAHNPYARLEYRLDAREIHWTASSRFEVRRTPTPDDRYTRWTHTLEVDAPLSLRDGIHAELAYRPRRYTERVIETAGGVEERRRDRQWEPSVLWSHLVRRDLELRAGYAFETRTSNDPDKHFTAHRLTLSLLRRW